MAKRLFFYMCMIFATSRDPFHDQIVHKAVESNIKLTGIMYCKNTTCAMFKNEGNEYRQVVVGDMIDGWSVQSIRETSVELKHAKNNKQLVLEMAR